MIPFDKFRRVLELKESDRRNNQSLIDENRRLRIENELLRRQVEGKIYDV